MIRFAIFLILFFVLIGVCVYYKNYFNSKLYIVVISLIVATFVVGFIYTSLDNSSGVLKQDILNIYKSGKELDCNGIKVSNKTHGFDNGTSVFIDNKNYQKIDMFICK